MIYARKIGFRYLSKIMCLDTSTKTVVVPHNLLRNSKDHSLNAPFAKSTWSGAADLLSKHMTPLFVDMGTSSKSGAFSQPTEENRLSITSGVTQNTYLHKSTDSQSET